MRALEGRRLPPHQDGRDSCNWSGTRTPRAFIRRQILWNLRWGRLVLEQRQLAVHLWSLFCSRSCVVPPVKRLANATNLACIAAQENPSDASARKGILGARSSPLLGRLARPCLLFVTQYAR